MEARAVGAIDQTQLSGLVELLTAISGHKPAPINIHETVLRCQGAGRQEVNLRHFIIPADDQCPQIAEKWIACSYSRPTWGDLNMAKLPATILTVTKSECSGPDVPGFWKSLGFQVQYQHYKSGQVFEIQRGSYDVQILLSKLHRVVTDQKGTLNPGDEVVPGQILIEASVEFSMAGVAAGEERHKEAIAAIVEVGKLLESRVVELKPLPDARMMNRAPPRQ